jgi:hypothetical protein
LRDFVGGTKASGSKTNRDGAIGGSMAHD